MPKKQPKCSGSKTFSLGRGVVLKALVLTSFIGICSSFNTACASDINPIDYLDTEYGVGNNSFYFGLVQENGEYNFTPADSSNYDLKVNYGDVSTPESYDNTTISEIIGEYINESSHSISIGKNAVVNNIETTVISSKAPLGAVYNSGNIDSITGLFVNNNFTREIDDNRPVYVKGAAIANYGTVNLIKGIFINNSVNSFGLGNRDAWGGAIDSEGVTKRIEGLFVNNHATAYDSTNTMGACGGAIINYREGAYGTIEEIDGTFVNNYVIDYSTGLASGGAIYFNPGTIKTIKGNFIGNHAISNGNALGGAIYLRSGYTVDSVSGNFLNNYSIGNGSGQAAGGALMINSTTIENVTSNFDGNYVRNTSSGNANAGALNINLNGAIVNLLSNFTNNYTISKSGIARAGATINYGTISSLDGIYKNNYAMSEEFNAFGGAIANMYSNSNSKGIYNLKGVFLNNYVQANNGLAQGGAIYNDNQIGTLDENSILTGGISNSNFIGNYAKTKTGTAQGGAIFTSSDLNIIANNGDTTFKDNYVQKGEGEKDYQAIWVADASKQLSLKQINNGKMYMYDNINGADGYTVNIQGDGTGTYYMLNDIYNANVTFDNTTINSINNQIHTYNFNSLNLAGNTNFVADVDLVH